MPKILVVDDERSIRNTFEIFLSKDGHEIFLAEDATSAIRISKIEDLDLIITDIIMPRITGINLLAEIKSTNPDIPIIIMTGEPTVETAKEAVRSAANDYLIKPVSKINLLKSVNFALEKKKLTDEKKRLENENARYRENLELLVKKRTLALEKAVNGTIETIIKILEYKDPYTANHQRRVSALAMAISEKMNLGEDVIDRIYFAGYLHDIGKMFVPSELLSKPGNLTSGEFEVIKEHVKNGFDLTDGIELTYKISDIILQHHERIDGSGYPNGLLSNDIHLCAKVLAVADVIEAMSSHRPYRPGFELKIALDEIKSNAGILYDADVSKAAIELFEVDKYDYSNVKHSILV